MAALDFSQFASQPSFGERYAQGQQQALQNKLAKQQLQSAEQQNQLNQMTMQEKERGQQEMNALRGLMSSPDFDLSTPASQRKVYELAPTQAENILKGYYGNLKTAAEVKNLDFTGQEVQAKAAAERAKIIAQAGRDINSRPDDENIISYDRDIQNSPLFTPEEKQAASNRTKQLLAMPMADRATYLSQQGATAGELRSQVVTPGASLVAPGAKTPYFTAPPAPTAPTKSIGSVSPGDFTPASVAKFNVSGNYGDLVPKPVDRAPREAAVRTQQVTMNDGTLGIMNMDTGAVTPATLGGIPISQGDRIKPLTEQQTIKLRTDVAKDYKSASTTLSQMDDLLASIQSVKTAPGLSAATGYTGVYLPSFSEGKAATAETRVANLRGKVTALGKATAAMSGAIGSIANQEWKILADQVANIDLVKGKGPLLEQIELIEAQAKGAMERIRDQYEKTRAEDFKRFPQFKDLPAPGAPVAVPSPGAPTRANAAKADPKAEAAAFLKSMGVTQ